MCSHASSVQSAPKALMPPSPFTAPVADPAPNSSMISPSYAAFLARTGTWSFQVLMPEEEDYVRMSYADLPAWARSLRVMHRYRNAPHWRDTGFRCFFTGLECRLVAPKVFQETGGRHSLLATIEHMVPQRHDPIHGLAVRHMGNELLACRAANVIVDHKPLPIKMLNRHGFRQAAVSEEQLLTRPFRTLIDAAEPLEKALEVRGIRPWNPQALLRPDVVAAARDFMCRMHAAEAEYLALPIDQRLAWLDEFDLERWIGLGAGFVPRAVTAASPADDAADDGVQDAPEAPLP